VKRSRRTYALVRLCSVVIVGLVSGALGDGGTEFFNALGWLGGGVADSSHQGVLPALIAGLLLAFGLGIVIVGARIAHDDPLLCELGDRRARAFDVLAALLTSCLVVLLIEGYETQFGGTAPFQAGSIVLGHAPVLLASFVAIAIGARALLGAAILWAARHGAAAVALLITFLRKLRARAAALKHDAATFLRDVVAKHESPDLLRACAPRAPPLLPTLN